MQLQKEHRKNAPRRRASVRYNLNKKSINCTLRAEVFLVSLLVCLLYIILVAFNGYLGVKSAIN